jgi:hypothetical protein
MFSTPVTNAKPSRQMPLLAVPGDRVEHVYSGLRYVITRDQSPIPELEWIHDHNVVYVSSRDDGLRVPLYRSTVVILEPTSPSRENS